MSYEGCVLCAEAITNPVCVACLEREIEQWLGEKKASLAMEVRDRTNIFNSYSHQITNCILCKGNMSVCAHCYCGEIYEWLLGDFKDIAEDFLWVFNFEIRDSS